MKATWNGVVLAESDATVVVEGNHYFPQDSLRWEHFAATDTTSVCPWKGQASYFTVTADGKSNPDAAWTYKTPKPAADNIAGYVAFWRGVQVTE